MREAVNALLFAPLLATSAFAETPRIPQIGERAELTLPSSMVRPAPITRDLRVEACAYDDNDFERGSITLRSLADGFGIIVSMQSYFFERMTMDSDKQAWRHSVYLQSLSGCSAEDFFAARMIMESPASTEPAEEYVGRGQSLVSDEASEWIPLYSMSTDTVTDFISDEITRNLELLRDPSQRES